MSGALKADARRADFTARGDGARNTAADRPASDFPYTVGTQPSRRSTSTSDLLRLGCSASARAVRNDDSVARRLPPVSLSRKETWRQLTDYQVLQANLCTDHGDVSGDGEGTDRPDTSREPRDDGITAVEAIVFPARLAALEACDAPVIQYHPYSFFRDVLRIRGRNFPMMVPPLLALILWDGFWGLMFDERFWGMPEVQERMKEWQAFTNPLLTPISFLLTFRLGRAAIRFWDARASAGKITQVCRDSISTASVACASSQRSATKGNCSMKDTEGQCQEDWLLEEYARWLAVFPVAVKNFLRPEKRKGWDDETRYKKQRFEIGPLLEEKDAQRVLSQRYGPLVVLDKLREIAFSICFSACSGTHDPQSTLHAAGNAALYKQLSEQIDALSGASGAMERINGTPLPFVYVAHLRTFLLLYLFLINMTGMANYGWPALAALFVENVSLLGIEAASVECECPFKWNPNHLPLGKYCAVVAQNIAQTLNQVQGRF